MIYALITVIALQTIIHHIERKDLYNRIMSKTLSEYKGEKPKGAESAHKRAIKAWREKGGDIE